MHKKQWQFFLILSVCILFVLGLVMIFSTSSAEILDHFLQKSTHADLFKQMLSACGGWILALMVWKLGYKRWLKFSPYLYLFSLLLLLLCLIPGIGREVNGSRRWLVLMGFSFQPSEFVKFIIPSFLIHRYLQKNSPLTLRSFLIHLIWIAPALVLIFLEPNNGTVGVILVSLVPLFFLLQIPVKYWGVPLLFFALIGGVCAYHLPYVRGRLKVYWNPELDVKGKGHQPLQAKIAAGSGKLWGKGPGNSLQKYSYLPEAQNDYIAAIFAEEYGFLGMMGLILVYMVLALCGFTIAFLAREEDAYLLGTMFCFLICFQAFLNLGVVSGLLPSTGLNLPYFSQGGTSLMANMMAIGILLDIGGSR